MQKIKEKDIEVPTLCPCGNSKCTSSRFDANGKYILSDEDIRFLDGLDPGLDFIFPELED